MPLSRLELQVSVNQTRLTKVPNSNRIASVQLIRSFSQSLALMVTRAQQERLRWLHA